MFNVFGSRSYIIAREKAPQRKQKSNEKTNATKIRTQCYENCDATKKEAQRNQRKAIKLAKQESNNESNATVKQRRKKSNATKKLSKNVTQRKQKNKQ